MRELSFLMLFASANINATTYLCIPEAGAAVENTGTKNFQSHVYDVSNYKLIMSDESGKWQLKQHGSNQPQFDNCSSEYYCEDTRGFSGVFFRSDDGQFTYVFHGGFESPPGRHKLISLKGLCSKI